MARNFVKLAAELEAKLIAQDPASADRKIAGYMVVEAANPWIYVHHDNGVGRNSYAEALEALAAERITVTVGDGIRAV